MSNGRIPRCTQSPRLLDAGTTAVGVELVPLSLNLPPPSLHIVTLHLDPHKDHGMRLVLPVDEGEMGQGEDKTVRWERERGGRQPQTLVDENVPGGGSRRHANLLVILPVCLLALLPAVPRGFAL